MTKLKALLGLTVACAACCAVPIALPFLLALFGGAGLAGTGALLAEWGIAIAGASIAATAAILLLRRRAPARC